MYLIIIQTNGIISFDVTVQSVNRAFSSSFLLHILIEGKNEKFVIYNSSTVQIKLARFIKSV